MARDYYAVLGLSKTASAKEIKKAYHKLSLEYHPDRNTERDAKRKFQEIGEAYAVLSDEGLRREYDRRGPSSAGGFSTNKFNAADFFEKQFENMRNGTLPKDDDCLLDLNVSQEEMENGVARRKIKRKTRNGGYELRLLTMELSPETVEGTRFRFKEEGHRVIGRKPADVVSLDKAAANEKRLSEDDDCLLDLFVSHEVVENGVVRRKIKRKTRNGGYELRLLTMELSPETIEGTWFGIKEEAHRIIGRKPADVVFVIRKT